MVMLLVLSPRETSSLPLLAPFCRFWNSGNCRRGDGDGYKLVKTGPSKREERLMSSDLVIASDKASFGLPEVKRGVFAKAGALGRIIRFIGLHPPFPTPASLYVSPLFSHFYLPPNSSMGCRLTGQVCKELPSWHYWGTRYLLKRCKNGESSIPLWLTRN
jgi:hypothetical protein